MGQRRGDKGWLGWSVKMRAGTVSKNDFSVIALYDREHGTFVFYCSTILLLFACYTMYNVQGMFFPCFHVSMFQRTVLEHFLAFFTQSKILFSVSTQ